MPELYDRYQQGFHQEVYDELLAMQEHVFEEHIYNDALLVARAIMRRVRSNMEQLIPRLHKLGYLFGKDGFWEELLSPDKKASLERDYPIFQPPTPETLEQVALLEHLVGPLPLSVKCWYEEVGCVNLIGLFPANKRGYGPVLDPLFIYSVGIVLQMVSDPLNEGEWEKEPVLPLAPDRYFKYGYSGSGPYAITLPCKAVDAPFLDEPHHTTFVNYLRICLR